MKALLFPQYSKDTCFIVVFTKNNVFPICCPGRLPFTSKHQLCDHVAAMQQCDQCVGTRTGWCLFPNITKRANVSDKQILGTIAACIISIAVEQCGLSSVGRAVRLAASSYLRASSLGTQDNVLRHQRNRLCRKLALRRCNHIRFNIYAN